MPWVPSAATSAPAPPSSGSTSVRWRPALLVDERDLTVPTLAVAWSTTLGFILYSWYQIRKSPKSTGFAIPGARLDDEAFAHSDSEPVDGSTVGYRPSGDYYTGEGESRLFAETAPGYGDDAYHPRATDPFADQETYGEQGRYDEVDSDPYAAIRKVSCLRAVRRRARKLTSIVVQSMDVPGARPSY